MDKKAVLVMAYGSPDSLADVEPYLLDIRGGRPTPPELVAEIRSRYARIGGCCPLLDITRAQASLLEKYLNQETTAREQLASFRVYVGMRHWKPYIREAVAQIAADEFKEGVAICMAPHASKMSSGAYFNKLKEAQAALQAPIKLDFIESWYDRPFLIQSLARKVRAAVQEFPPDTRPDIYYLFTAHSLPAVLKEEGDPYFDQLQTTARLLAKELGLADAQWTLGFQSAGASAVQWMGPAIREMLPQFVQANRKNILITPVGFVSDNVEILFDLDIEAQEIARQHGIRLIRSESLNDSADFIQGLAAFIFEKSGNGSNGSGS